MVAVLLGDQHGERSRHQLAGMLTRRQQQQQKGPEGGLCRPALTAYSTTTAMTSHVQVAVAAAAALFHPAAAVAAVADLVCSLRGFVLLGCLLRSLVSASLQAAAAASACLTAGQVAMKEHQHHSTRMSAAVSLCLRSCRGEADSQSKEPSSTTSLCKQGSWTSGQHLQLSQLYLWAPASHTCVGFQAIPM